MGGKCQWARLVVRQGQCSSRWDRVSILSIPNQPKVLTCTFRYLMPAIAYFKFSSSLALLGYRSCVERSQSYLKNFDLSLRRNLETTDP